MVNTNYYTIPIKCYKYLIDGSFIKQLRNKFEEALKNKDMFFDFSLEIQNMIDSLE